MIDRKTRCKFSWSLGYIVGVASNYSAGHDYVFQYDNKTCGHSGFDIGERYRLFSGCEHEHRGYLFVNECEIKIMEEQMTKLDRIAELEKQLAELRKDV